MEVAGEAADPVDSVDLARVGGDDESGDGGGGGDGRSSCGASAVGVPLGRADFVPPGAIPPGIWTAADVVEMSDCGYEEV